LDISPEVKIRSTIKPGSVYYFREETLHSDQPHYFIVILVLDVTYADETADKDVLLVCVSSKIANVKRLRSGLSKETLVEISPTGYPELSVDSIVDCNDVRQKSVSELVQKLSQGKLSIKKEMNAKLIRKIHKGVLASTMVERNVKSLFNL
jgi:hypothetical protein